VTVVDGLRSRWWLRGCAAVGEGSRATGYVWIWGGGRVVLGRDVLLDAAVTPIEFHAFEGGEILLGDGVVVEGGASIEAMASVSVGAGARLGGFCKIMDNNFHRLTGSRVEVPPSVPVVIEKDVVLGPGSIVVGCRIGEGAEVGARTVVNRRVPARAHANGNPMVIQREAKR
jgi:acetyltransferase-like isoleucine patch superfamily enzyme